MKNLGKTGITGNENEVTFKIKPFMNQFLCPTTKKLNEPQIDTIVFNSETELLRTGEGYCEKVRIYVNNYQLDDCISGKIKGDDVQIHVGFYSNSGYEQDENEILVLCSFNQISIEDFDDEDEIDLGDWIRDQWVGDYVNECRDILENYTYKGRKIKNYCKTK